MSVNAKKRQLKAAADKRKKQERAETKQRIVSSGSIASTKRPSKVNRKRKHRDRSDADDDEEAYDEGDGDTNMNNDNNNNEDNIDEMTALVEPARKKRRKNTSKV